MTDNIFDKYSSGQTSTPQTTNQSSDTGNVFDKYSPQGQQSQQDRAIANGTVGFASHLWGGIKNLASATGNFLTSSEQAFGRTLGTAASVISPEINRNRQASLKASGEAYNNYMKLAQKTTDKNKKAQYLEMAKQAGDTAGVDIFNQPEYQKTAEQIYGEGLGVATDIIGAGTIGSKAAKGVQLGETALKATGKGALIGVTTGAIQGLAGGMQENLGAKGLAKSTALGATVGAVTGSAIGYFTTPKKLNLNDMAEYTSPRLTPTEKGDAYKVGKLKSETTFKSEKFIPNKKDLELGQLAKDTGLTGKNYSQDISKVNKSIANEAISLRNELATSGKNFNKTEVVSQLNNLKKDSTSSLTTDEEKIYNKFITKFKAMLGSKDNNKIESLLDIRQEFDNWAKDNSPKIFDKTNGSSKAVKSVRNAVNTYINDIIGKNDFVKNSLAKQTNLYTILDNISEKAGHAKPFVSGGTIYNPSKIGAVTKKVAPKALTTGAAVAAGYGAVKGYNKLKNTILETGGQSDISSTGE